MIILYRGFFFSGVHLKWQNMSQFSNLDISRKRTLSHMRKQKTAPHLPACLKTFILVAHLTTPHSKARYLL